MGCKISRALCKADSRRCPGDSAVGLWEEFNTLSAPWSVLHRGSICNAQVLLVSLQNPGAEQKQIRISSPSWHLSDTCVCPSQTTKIIYIKHYHRMKMRLHLEMAIFLDKHFERRKKIILGRSQAPCLSYQKCFVLSHCNVKIAVVCRGVLS